MKLSKIALLLLVAATLLAPGCSENDDDNFFAGYSNPGEFRPKGVAPEKAYTFASLDDCAGTACQAIYCIWYAGDLTSTYIPTEGVAVEYQGASNRYRLILSRVPGTPWQITLVQNGILYSYYGTDIPNITLTELTSAVETLPAYTYDPDGTPANGDEVVYEASGIFLKLVRVDFASNIVLETADRLQSVTISAGDSIIAQHHGI